jgi:hypothetical protein
MKEEKSLGDIFIDTLDGHKCDDCGEYKDDVGYVVYTSEIYNKEIMAWLCGNCYHGEAGKIQPSAIIKK